MKFNEAELKRLPGYRQNAIERHGAPTGSNGHVPTHPVRITAFGKLIGDSCIANVDSKTPRLVGVRPKTAVSRNSLSILT